jgi:hypothetical protein
MLHGVREFCLVHLLFFTLPLSRRQKGKKRKQKRQQESEQCMLQTRTAAGS